MLLPIFVSEIRARYDRQYEIIEQHITLVFPTDKIEQEKLCDHVANIVGQFAPLEIQFRSVAVVYGKYEKLWYLFLIPDKGNEYITKLHDALYSGIMANELRTDIPFVPHMTIGIFDNPTDAGRVTERLNGSNISISSSLDSVVITRDGSDETKRIEKITTIFL